jgi:hypothetical protein
MKNLVGMTVVAFAILLVSAAEPVQAQGYCGGGGIGYYGLSNRSFGQIDGLYRTGAIPIPPYFALHPPVYYSQPVARPYGYSPFAYPGSVRTPEIAPVVAAKAITNPHVTPTKTKKSVDLNLTSNQLEILNPFVTRSGTKMVSYDK